MNDIAPLQAAWSWSCDSLFHFGAQRMFQWVKLYTPNLVHRLTLMGTSACMIDYPKGDVFRVI